MTVVTQAPARSSVGFSRRATPPGDLSPRLRERRAVGSMESDVKDGTPCVDRRVMEQRCRQPVAGRHL